MDECESQPAVLRVSADGLRIALRGEIDMGAAAAVAAAFERAIDLAAGVVLVDVADVTFLDSCGLRAILAGMRSVQRRGGAAHLTAMSAPVVRLLEITGLGSTSSTRT